MSIVYQHEYKARPSSRFLTDNDAPTLGAWVEQEGDGGVTPEALVQEARRKSSPLHNLPAWKGWNTEDAAAEWYQHAARNVLGSLITLVVKVEDDERKVVARSRSLEVVQVPADDGTERKYMPLKVIVANADFDGQVQARFAAELESIYTRMSQYEEMSAVQRKLAGVIALMRKAIPKKSPARKVASA